MYIKNTSALFIRFVAAAALLLFGFTRIYAAEEGTVYQAHLTALTDDPVFQEYLRNLKREAAASAQSATKPAPSSQPTTHQPRVIEISDDSEASTAAPNTTSRFIFTSAAAKPLVAGPGLNASVTEAAIIQNAVTRTSQIEHLRQRASGSNAQ